MKHRILILEVDIRLYDGSSLKEKRSVRRRLTDRLKQSYNVSIAETGYLDLWQRIGLTIAYVSIDESTANNMADTLRDAIENILGSDGELMSVDVEII